MIKGTVILVPGNFASTLAEVTPLGKVPIWFNPPVLLTKFGNLSLPPSSGTPTIEATGILPGYFTIMSTAISIAGFHVVPFPYDWRQDTDITAQSLLDVLTSTTPPIYVITHSLGANVARRAIQWMAAQHGADQVLTNVIEMIMLGPAIYGTLAGAIGLAGATQELPSLAVLPQIPASSQRVLATFPSLYQVLPYDSSKIPSIDNPDYNVRVPGFWGGLINSDLLLQYLPTGAPPWAATIDTEFFTTNTTIILGDAQSTAGGVTFRGRGGSLVVDPSYNVAGDGFVPRSCSLMDDRPDTYIASGVGHLKLPLAEVVIKAILSILHGFTPSLPRYSQ